MPAESDMRQVNIRIPEDSRAILEAEAFLEGVSMTTLIRDVLYTAMHLRAATYREAIESGTMQPTEGITDFLRKYEAGFPVEDASEDAPEAKE